MLLRTIFFDIGSHKVLFGRFGSEEDSTPAVSFTASSRVGIPVIPNSLIGYGGRDLYICDEAFALYAPPLEINGIFHNEHLLDVEIYHKVVEHLFYNELREDSLECQLICAHHPLMSPETMEKIAQIYFEHLTLHSYIPVNSLWLELLGLGQREEYVINFGHFETNMAFFSCGKMRSYQSIPIGGYNMIKIMIDSATESGISLCNTIIHEPTPKLLKNCRFSMNYEKERREILENPIKTWIPVEFMPNHHVDGFIVDTELVDCPEMYFQPLKIVGIKSRTIVEMITDCFKENNDWDSDRSRTLCLSGGGSRIPGLELRLKSEMDKVLKIGSVKLIRNKDARTHDEFIGAEVIKNMKDNSTVI